MAHVKEKTKAILILFFTKLSIISKGVKVKK